MPAMRYKLVGDELEMYLADEVRIVIAPVNYPAEVIGLVGFGNYNQNPAPAVHVAVHAYWHKNYQAEPLAATESAIELFVRNPPQDKDAAIALALQVYNYCPDNVWQGASSIENLASLLRRQYWSFWWD